MKSSHYQRATFFLVACCLFSWFSVRTATAEVQLRWKLSAGQTLNYQFRQRTQTETAGTGKAMRVELETAMSVTWKVEAVDYRRVATMTQTIDQFSLTMKTDKLDPITYNSANKVPTAAGPLRELAEVVGKLIGVPCRIQMSDRGEISSTEATELQRALEPKPGSTPLFTPEQISAMLRQAALVLPEKAIAEGDKWEATQTIDTPSGQVAQTSKYAYEGTAERDGAKQEKLTVTAVFEQIPAEDSKPAFKITESQQTGTFWFDSNAGQLTGSECIQKLVTERPYRDLTIRVQSNSTLSMKLAGS